MTIEKDSDGFVMNWPSNIADRLAEAERLLLTVALEMGGVGLHNSGAGMDILRFFGVEYYAHLPSLEEYAHD